MQKKHKSTAVVAESAESGVNGAKNHKNTTKSGVNDDVETLSVTSSEESVKVVGVERPGQSRKQTVAKSLSDHAAKIVNKPSERKNTNVQQSRQVELMNNDSKENKGVIGIRGKSRNTRTAWQTSLPLSATSKVTENQQQSQASSGVEKVKVDSDSDSSLDREEAEYQSILQQATCSKGKKPKSEKQQKKDAAREEWFDPKKFDTKRVKHPPVVKKPVPQDDDVIFCNKCNTVFDTVGNLRDHEKNCFKGRRYPCS